MTSDRLTTALHQNKVWAAKVAQEHPDLFPKLAARQQPEILWIGCSDSRCPETTLLGLKPGDVFVHRNIANVLHGADLSASAVIEYSIRQLGVKHVVVCGHTQCGGVAAALGNQKLGILDPWLLPLRRLRDEHRAVLKSLPDDQAALKLVEMNVIAGVKTLKGKSVVVEAMQRGLKVHGLVYDVGSGVLREIDISESGEVVKRRFSSFRTEASAFFSFLLLSWLAISAWIYVPSVAG
ncbi:carbonic anhydrase [Aspergillus egyptiacus]|nr:carbonic anhydrase [Aspergillus egyptiacus]